MFPSVLRVMAGAGAVLCLSAAMVSGQSVRIIKLIRNDQTAPLELTATGAEPPPLRLPTPIQPELGRADRPGPTSTTPYSPIQSPPRFAPSMPPVHAAPVPPAYRPGPAPWPPQPATTSPYAPRGPGVPVYQEPSAPIMPAAPPANACRSGCGVLDDSVFWLRAEALLWWVGSQQLPPLVTSGLPGTTSAGAGAIGGFGTNVVIGNQGINGNVRSGARFSAGLWFNSNQMTGVTGDYFFLGRSSDSLEASFDGGTPLARPFFDASTGATSSSLIGFPGVVTGRVQVTGTGSTIEGGSALLRQRLVICYTPEGTPLWRMDAVGGYRFLNLAESLGVQTDLIATGAGGPAGSPLVIHDSFQTRNTFHGFDVGLINELRGGPFSLELTTRLAVGSMDQRVSIYGNRTFNTPTGPVAASGGLLAQATNSGTHNRSEATLIPEVGANLGWQISPGLRLFTGYNFIYIADVVRPGDQIDLMVDPRLLPPSSTTVGATRPALAYRTTDLWLQGMKIGLEVRY